VRLMPQEPGQYGGEIVLGVQFESGLKTISIPVTANVVPVVSVLPSRMTLPRDSGSGPIYSFTCTVRSSSGMPLIVHTMNLPEGFSADISDFDQPSMVKHVLIRWEPDHATPHLDNIAIPLVVEAGPLSYVVSVQVECRKP
jgi:hypothetical protein